MAEPLKVKAPREKRFVKTPDAQRDPESAAYVPTMPTNGNDLLGLWDLPTEAMTQARLKVGRQKYGTKQLELVAEVTPQDYSLESIARNYGAGDYLLVLNPGPRGAWPAKNARLTVSAEYARECGFDPFPAQAAAAPPRFAEIRSMQETARATQPGQTLTPEVLGQLVETIAERVAARTRPAAPAADGITQMMQFWTMFQGMQENSLKTALMLAGIKTPATLPDEPEEESWPSLIKELIPIASQVVTGIFAPKNNPTPEGPRDVTPNQEGPAVNVPMNEEEMKRFAPALSLLKPYSGLILRMLEKVQDGASISGELASYIPGRLDDVMVDFCEMAKDRGPGVLALLDPALATEKGLAALVGIGKILNGETDG